jgi:AbrB family looped-hinge helix DNA binding protein
MGNTKTTTVTVKGQVTLPKAVREAAGIRPGDHVVARALPAGGVIVERANAGNEDQNYRARLQSLAKRRPFRGLTTDGLMKITRGDD